MKTITFNYTKKDGSTSERTLLAMITPGGDKYAGIDLSSIDENDASDFVKEAKDLYDDYIEKLQKLQVTYDLKHNYRQFLVNRMTDVVEI